MDILSSPWIPYCTVALGVAMLPFKNHTLRLSGLWFIAEFFCLLLTVGINTEADASQMRLYRYLYAIAAIQFIWYTTKNNSFYSDKLTSIFLAIAVLTVLSANYHWFMQSNWGSWGESFYYKYSSFVDWSYFLTVVLLEAKMILIGVNSVPTGHIDTNPDERNGGKW